MSSEKDKPIILHLDSMEIHNRSEIVKNIKSFIAEESDHWQKIGLSKIVDKEIHVPQQKNCYDCGVFVLLFIEHFIRQAPERLRVEHLRMFGYHWFKPEEASTLRTKIKSLLEKICQSETNREEELHNYESLNAYIERSGIGPNKRKKEPECTRGSRKRTKHIPFSPC
ncbi:hypothetical protein L1887_05822 [Cichorium endivia]|nr:hypothetical protein L1887_05822 [Cichorium endivia]